jgi:hypothetical protein
MPLPFQVQQILADLLGTQLIRRLLVVTGQSCDSLKIGFVSARRKPAQSHLIDHALTQFAHCRLQNENARLTVSPA